MHNRHQRLQVIGWPSSASPGAHSCTPALQRFAAGPLLQQGTHAPGCPSCRPGQLPLLLLSEMLKGTDSFWHAYVQHLPRHHNLLVRWSTSELAALQDATLVSEVMKKPYIEAVPGRLSAEGCV